jgi:hypothetical protein
MPTLHIEISNPLVPKVPDAMVLGTIRLSDPEQFVFHTLEVVLVSRTHDGLATEYEAHTLRMAGSVPGGEQKHIPFTLRLPATTPDKPLDWEATATLSFPDGPPLRATAVLGQEPAPPVLPDEPMPATSHLHGFGLWAFVGHLVAALFLLGLGTTMLLIHPVAPTPVLMVKAILGAIALLAGVVQWVGLLHSTPSAFVKVLGSLLGVAYCTWVMMGIGLLGGASEEIAPATWAIDPTRHLPWAICLPVLWLGVIAPWTDAPPEIPALLSIRVLVALHGLCLLPLVALQAPEFWRNELLVTALALTGMLFNAGLKMAWRNLSMSWVVVLALASVPSLIALLVWDPVYGWRAALGLFWLLRIYLGLSLLNQTALASFGHVKARLVPQHPIRCERMYLIIAIDPPDPLTIVEAKATLSCTRASSNLSTQDPDYEVLMQREYPLHPESEPHNRITFSTIIPHDAQPTIKTQDLSVEWKVTASLHAKGSGTWTTTLPVEVRR